MVDVLKYLNPNLSENDTDPKFRSDYTTWDSKNNKLVTNKGEYHRPDRCFFSGSLRPISLTRIVNSYSDHYGLFIKFLY